MAIKLRKQQELHLRLTPLRGEPVLNTPLNRARSVFSDSACAGVWSAPAKDRRNSSGFQFFCELCRHSLAIVARTEVTRENLLHLFVQIVMRPGRPEGPGRIAEVAISQQVKKLAYPGVKFGREIAFLEVKWCDEVTGVICNALADRGSILVVRIQESCGDVDMFTLRRDRQCSATAQGNYRVLYFIAQ